MISVLLMCYDRQTMLNHTLPRWTTQKGIDFEILLCIGPSIAIPKYEKSENFKGLRISYISEPKLCKTMNKLLAAAKYDIILTSFTDLDLNTDYQIKRMYDLWTDNRMVTDRVFRNGKRNIGVYLDMMMVSREALQQAGGWCELYDDPLSMGHEDGDLVSTMLENGMQFEFMETPDNEAVYHIWHPSPCMTDQVNIDRFEYGRKIYFSRHKEGIMALYAKQMCGKLRTKVFV